MPARRMQIYLTEAQRDRIDQVIEAEGIPMAEVIRRALDQYLSDDAEATAAPRSTFGADSVATSPSRDGWRRR